MNCTDTDVQTVFIEMERNKSVLFIKHSNVTTNAVEKKTWDCIGSEINTANNEQKRKALSFLEMMRTEPFTCFVIILHPLSLCRSPFVLL